MKSLLVAAMMMGSVSLVRADDAAPVVDARAQYEAAYQAMLAGEFGRAASEFAATAAMTDDPELRSAANQLARLANDLATRNARLAFGTLPPSGGPPGVPDDAPVGLPARVEGGDTAAISEDDAPDGGRATFVVTTTIASLYSGVVLADLVDVDDIRTGTLIVLGTTTAGVLGSLYGTKGKRMTGAMADSWGLGLTVGAANALLLSGPLGLFDSTSNTSEKIQTLTLGAAWGTATAGLLFADAYNPTRAQVGITGTIGMMGVASTLLGFAIIQPDDLDGDTFLTVTALGLDASLVAGGAFARRLDWSQSRARYVGLGALLGGLAGIGGSLLLFADDGGDNIARVAAGITLGGLWGGFALATHLTRDMAPDFRYRVKQGVQANVLPTRIKDAPGLAVVGAF